MHKVSRTLLLAGVLAFGTLTAACGDKVEIVGPPATVTGVTGVTVSPSTATVSQGQTITLSAIVTADAATAKTVTWSSSNNSVATVSSAGVVTGVAGGSVTITATSTADATKAAGAAVTVIGSTPAAIPTISIATVTDVNGNPVQLGNVTGQVNVTVNTSGGGTIDIYLAPAANCASAAIAANDVKVATQVTTSPQAGQVTLSFNTAALTAANAPQFPNGNYCVKARLISGTTTVSAANTTPVTLNNVNVFRGTIAFASQTGGPTSAVSSVNGLNYNQGTLTATINPVVFTSASPVALISGYLTRLGEQNGGGSPGVATFTNASVTAGTATVVFPDTAGAAAGRSIYLYTSTSAGDTLVITSATDAAGNPIAVPNNSSFSIPTAVGVRIDNDYPNNAATTYQVTAPNGYVGAAYTFSTGTGGTAAADNRGGINGVGGVTTTYYVGSPSLAAFGTPNSCDVTGLTAATTGSSLANTTATNADRAKVVVMDALGNKVCNDAPSTYAAGLFGVDKILPLVALSTSQNGASDQTGYNVTKNFSFVYSDSISGFDATPLDGTLQRQLSTSPAANGSDCVIGVFNATTLACAPAPITFTTVTAVANSSSLLGSIEFTNGTAVPGYYTVSAVAIDQALNVSGAPVTRKAAFDPVATPPAVAAPTQSPAAVAPLGTVTVSATATDNLDLISSRGNLRYATSAQPFARVAGNTLGTFGQFITSATATVALPNVYRGLQSTDGAGVIQANTAVPTATVTVTDVGTNAATSVASVIATTTAATNVQVGNTLTLQSSAAAGTASSSVATTNLTAQVQGNSSDPLFQSQPFAQVDFYKCSITTSATCAGGELTLIGSQAAAAVNDNPVTGRRTFTYTLSGAALSAGTGGGATAAANNVFYAVPRTVNGDAVISLPVAQLNP